MLISREDLKALTTDDPSLLQSARPAFKQYNEEQLTTVKLPESGKTVRLDLILAALGWEMVCSDEEVGGGGLGHHQPLQLAGRGSVL